MEDTNHIEIRDLLLFIKGNIKNRKSENDEKLRTIAFHLANCEECFQKLKQIEYIMKSKENFNLIWEKCFTPVPAESADVAKIIGWIKRAFPLANKEFRNKLNEIETWITDNSEDLAIQLIPSIVTTRGSGGLPAGEDSETGLKGVTKGPDLKIHFEKNINFNLFKSKELRDGKLYLRCKSDPGFNTAILIKDDGSFITSKLDKNLCFMFSGINSKECFVKFENT